jgi:LEA14-like dessication related protein
MHRSLPNTLLALLVVPTFLTLGCASLGTLDSPELTLVNLQLTDATVFETTLEVQLRIANPNPEPITFNGAKFKLSLEDHKVGRGMSSETVTIPRLGTEVVSIPFHVNNATLLLRLKEILDTKSVRYGLQGTLYLERSLGNRKLKMQSEGQLDFAQQLTTTE